MAKCLNQIITEKFALYNGDCIEVAADLPSESVGFTIFSPPFADLYSYSDSERDLGNCKNYDVFFKQFKFLAESIFKITQTGRLVAVHCIDLPAMKERDGYIGMKDFSGDIIRLFQSVGFIYHSRHCIWKDPLIEATRTKAIGLMHKQLCKDSAMVRSGLPDYLLAFRKPGENKNPISHKDGLSRYAGSGQIPEGNRSHNIWRAYASPVWMDVRQTNTLNRTSARTEDDEKHICPLQLDTIERALTLWSNLGDIVFSPFAGIGSEIYQSILNGRRGLGIELKESYYKQAVLNCKSAMLQAKSDELL